jgi:hypothetical protein
MAHLTTKNLQKLCDILVSRPSWRVAMGALGASESLAFSWRMKSIAAQKDNDTSSPFFFEHRGIYDFFHCHAGRARLENVMLHESTIRDQSLRGIETVVRGPDQKILYQEREEYIGRSDAYVRTAEGLGDWEDDVSWHRLKRGPDGNPLPQTKVEQLPAPLRLRILEQDRRYVARQEIDTKISGEITVAKPLQRLRGEERPPGTLEKLKRLASMTAEQRREALGASAVPLDSTGRVTQVNRGVPLAIGDNRPDDGPELKKPPNPRAYQEPKLNPPTRPSYARPTDQSLDHGERTGRGEPPDGGMKMV